MILAAGVALRFALDRLAFWRNSMSVWRSKSRKTRRDSARRLSAACRTEPLEARTFLTVSPATHEFRANNTTLTQSVGTTPEVASDPDGNFVAVWACYVGGNCDIFARIFDSDGVPQG